MDVTASSGVFVILFLLATTLFWFAYLQSPGPVRNVLVILHVLSQMGPLFLSEAGLAHRPSSLLAFFFLCFSLHTLSILRAGSPLLNSDQTQKLTRRVQAVYKVWGNVRQIRLTTETDPLVSYARFALVRGTLVISLWAGNSLVYVFCNYVFRSLQVAMEDLHPSKCGRAIPLVTSRDFAVRTILSTHWIWTTYAALTGGHALLSIFFVAVLQWDSPEDWPKLFGSITEAYTLRRFWGVFWHRLHVAVFAAYDPVSLIWNGGPKQRRRARPHNGAVAKTIQALWMFFMSALCHAAVNRAVTGVAHVQSELWFFLCNFAACLAETVAGWAWKPVYPSKTRRWLGYAWVTVVLFCTSPGWQCTVLSVQS